MITNEKTLFFTFCKYTIKTAILSLLCAIAVTIIFFFIKVCSDKYLFALILYIPPIYGIYVTIQSLMNYKLRKEDYVRITKIFNDYGIKVSLLYELSDQ